MRAVVVGGGAAGLSAALAIQQAGWRCVVLETRDAIGVTALGLGAAAGAIAHHREALNLKRASLGENSPFTITARHRLGLALAADGQEARARIELSTALVTSRAILGAEHADTQAIEKALASLAQ